MAYQSDIHYKPTKDHGNADGLSRLSTQQDVEFDEIEDRENAEILCNIEEAVDGFPIIHEYVCCETFKDPALRSVVSHIRHSSWPKSSRLKFIAATRCDSCCNTYRIAC